MVLIEGLEPSRISSQDFESCVSAIPPNQLVYSFMITQKNVYGNNFFKIKTIDFISIVFVLKALF